METAYLERRVHIVFGNNTTPETDANVLANNHKIDDYVIDPDSFLEDFKDEFGIDMNLDTFTSFETIGDIVRWTEAHVTDKLDDEDSGNRAA